MKRLAQLLLVIPPTLPSPPTPLVRFHVKTPAEKITELVHDLAQADSGQFALELSTFYNHAQQTPANYQMLLQETRQCMDRLRKVLLKDHTIELDKRGRKVSQPALLVLWVCSFFFPKEASSFAPVLFSPGVCISDASFLMKCWSVPCRMWWLAHCTATSWQSWKSTLRSEHPPYRPV